SLPSGTDGVTVLLGDGTGSFAPPITTDLGFDAGSREPLAVADFNDDGQPDAAVTHRYSNKVSVLLNDGTWSAPDAPSITIGDVTVTEGNTGTTAVAFTVSLSAAYAQPVTVHFATRDGSAIAGSDYQANSGTVTFGPGETSKTITILVNGDRLGE